MQKTERMHLRVDPELKACAMDVFEAMGLTPSEGVRLFLMEVARRGELPIRIRTPNVVMRSAIDAARNGDIQPTRSK